MIVPNSFRGPAHLVLVRAGRRPLNQGGRGGLEFPFCPDDVHLSYNCNPQHPMKRCTRMKKSPEKKQTKSPNETAYQTCHVATGYDILFHFCSVRDVAWRGT